MNAKQFLEILGATMPGRPSPTRTASLRQLAPRLRMDVPEERMTRGLADAIAPQFRDVPAYADLLLAIQRADPGPAPGDEEGGSPLQADGPSGSEIATYVALLERRRAAGVDMKLLLSIAKRYYPTRAWHVLRAKHADYIARHCPHLDDRTPPATPEERAELWDTYRAKRLLAAAPPPRGPKAGSANGAGGSAQGAAVPGPRRADVRPDVLEQMRMAARVPPPMNPEEGQVS